MSCLVGGRLDRALTICSQPICRFTRVFCGSPAIRFKFLEPASSHVFQSSLRWLGMSRDEWKPMIRALVGIVVLAEKENVADGSYALTSSSR